MTKEKLQNERDNYKRLYETLKDEHEKLVKEKENIEIYKDLNLQLQLEVKQLEKEKDNLQRMNENLSTERNAYREIYHILTKVVGDKHCY